MTAPVGSKAFTTEQSVENERNIKNVMKRVVEDIKKEYKDILKYPLVWRKGYDLSEAYPNNQEAFLDNGKSSTSLPDGGIVKYGIHYIAMGEAKYKKERGNADERISGLIFDSDALGIKRINFYACLSGPCVERNSKGRFKSPATRKVVTRLDAAKVTKFLNSSYEVMYNTIKENILNSIFEINNTGV
jgi:hypothetical protein